MTHKIIWETAPPPDPAELGAEHKSAIHTTHNGVEVELQGEVDFTEGDGQPQALLSVKFPQGDFFNRNHLIAELRKWMTQHLEAMK